MLKNFETVKLMFEFPNSINWLLFFIIGVMAFYFREKKKTDFMDKTETEQLKGIAVLLVVIGHLWIHVAGKPADLVLSGDAVALFFILSGYGLSRSYNNSTQHNYSIVTFCKKRVARVMIPYWAATFLIIILDYLILNRAYGGNNLIQTFLGININAVTKHIDYVRWYISLLLFWYIVFGCLMIFFTPQKRGLLILLTGIILFPVHYYHLKFGWYQLFAFPVGCMLGTYHKQISGYFGKKKTGLMLLIISAIVVFFIYKIYLSVFFKTSLPYIIFSFIDEISSILVSMILILSVYLAGQKKLVSKLFVFLGGISYELFLLHGIFLIKYNPVISTGGTILTIFQICVFLVCISILALLFQKAIKPISLI